MWCDEVKNETTRKTKHECKIIKEAEASSRLGGSIKSMHAKSMVFGRPWRLFRPRGSTKVHFHSTFIEIHNKRQTINHKSVRWFPPSQWMSIYVENERKKPTAKIRSLARSHNYETWCHRSKKRHFTYILNGISLPVFEMEINAKKCSQPKLLNFKYIPSIRFDSLIHSIFFSFFHRYKQFFVSTSNVN